MKYFKSNNQKGSIYVESAASLPLYITLIIVFMGFIYVSYLALALQYVARFGVRELVVGPVSTGESAGSYSYTIKDKILARANSVGIFLDSSDITICPAINPNCNAVSPFLPNQLMVVKIAYSKSFYKRVFSLEGAGIGRTEPQTS